MAIFNSYVSLPEGSHHEEILSASLSANVQKSRGFP